MVPTETTQKTTNNKLFNISLLGMARATVGLPLEHPFETIKTWMQSEKQTPRQAMAHIYRRKGYLGFYAGFWVGSLRNISKATYRWPLCVYLINKFRGIFDRYGWGIGAAGTCAGLVTAILESVIICPMERVKVWLMTSYAHANYTMFWNLSAIKSFYDGFRPVLVKQILSWVSFLGTQEYLKQMLYQHLGKDPQVYQLNNWELGMVSVMVCLINTLLVMPADYIKTHFQKFSSLQREAPTLKAFIRQEYQSYGIRAFYRGGSIKMLHYNINSMLTVPMMQKMLRIMKE